MTYRDHVLCNPTSVAKLEEVVELLRLPDGAEVVDIACGKGELAIRLAERYGARVVGVDLSPYSVRDAQARAAGRGGRGSLTFVLADGATHAVAPGSLDMAACVGASWVFGGHAGTLAALGAMVRPGGLVLVGEPYWRADPPERYVQLPDRPRDLCLSHAANVAAGPPLGLTPLYALASSEDDWDRHECLHWQAAERYAAEHPDDPDVPELLARVHRARDAYLDAGRAVLGWSLYLFRRASG